LSRKRAYLSNLPETFNTFHSACYRPQNRYLENPPWEVFEDRKNLIIYFNLEPNKNSFVQQVLPVVAISLSVIANFSQVDTKLSPKFLTKFDAKIYTKIDTKLLIKLLQNFEPKFDTRLVTNF
jgi:hypothetical protein